MKKIYSTLVFLAIAAISFSQTYFVYTAKKGGYWYDGNNWDIQPRMDGKKKHKVIIPKTFTIIVDNNVNNMGLGDVEVFVSGSLDVVRNTTLLLSANSTIQLDNGSINGNAIDQKILIGSTIKYSGNLDNVKKEYSIADNTTGAAPLGFRAMGTMPVNFTSFYISKPAEDVQLNWSTNQEINNSHFDVERSFNGVEWKKIAVVFGSSNSNNTNNYSYNDKNISNPVVYYRLRQVDVNGRFIYSSIKSIRAGEAVSAVRIYGSDKNVIIDLNTSVKNNLVVSVVNTNGQLITKQSFNNSSYKINLHLQNATSGTYIVQVTDNKGWTEVKKVIL